MKKILWKCLAGFVAAGCLTGCQTTGDPRQGGLFGWSESKAIDRQERLREQLADSSARERSVQHREGTLVNRRAALESDVAIREERLRVLQEEVVALRRALAGGTISPKEAAREADRLRAPVARATGPGAGQLRADFATIDQQINLLTH